ncbi:MAG: manganese catalase family protein [Clostridia bacterium]|nr:manganese catalase family protein [Clostridia bacterium]
MWIYEKKLQYPVNIKNPNPGLAKLIISQLGGPDGELGASMRYLNQRYSMPYREVTGILTDVGTEGTGLHSFSHQTTGIPIPSPVRTV